MTEPLIAVFAGGTSAENEVSKGSGAACAKALARSYPTRLFAITSNALPEGYDPSVHVVFSTLHGTFGEDGGMQRLLEAAGGAYSGSDARASALAMDKELTKRAVAARVKVAEGLTFDGSAKPGADELGGRLGNGIVIKPNNEGSSVGLRIVGDAAGLRAALDAISGGRWMAERRIVGREVSVGILGGKAVGIVEIAPKSGVFDYTSKYTKGASEYTAPAPLESALDARVRAAAEAAFAACGCRDYARVDFIISEQGEPFFLEINTLPGMKETSLLPMCARCAGLDFTALVREMVKPAVERFHQRPGLAPPMSKEAHAMPDTRSWRDIPQQVKPRAMSGEGRRRLAMGFVRAVMGISVACVLAWGAWQVASVLGENPAGILGSATKADRVRSIVLVTDGVLDKNWLAGTLALPADATLMGLDLNKLRSRVMDDSQVLSADIIRNFPDKLTVRVSERTPVVRMMAQSGGGAPSLLLVARDGVPFEGRGFDPAMIATLPWIDGVTLARSGGRFAPIAGMKEVSDLLGTAKLEAEDLYRTWQVISLNRLESDGDIEVRTKSGLKVTFGTREDYLRQIARLDLLVGSATDPTRPLAEVNLALGSQVPVKFGSAAPVLSQPPVNTTGGAESRPLISFPALSTPHIDLKT